MELVTARAAATRLGLRKPSYVLRVARKMGVKLHRIPGCSNLFIAERDIPRMESRPRPGNPDWIALGAKKKRK